jgi:hypothetical protein
MISAETWIALLVVKRKVLGNIDIATNNELFLCKGNWSCATRIARIYFVDKRGI